MSKYLRALAEGRVRKLYLFSLVPLPPMPSSSQLQLFFLTLVVSVSAREVNLHHRVFVPSSAASPNGLPAVVLPPWVPRATAQILSSRLAKYSPVSNLNEELAAYTYRSEARTQPLALYQVALEVPGVAPHLWPFSSVKTVCIPYIPFLQLCGLGMRTSQSLTPSWSSSATSPTRRPTRYGSTLETTQNIRHTP